jgi:hypothetical protein
MQIRTQQRRSTQRRKEGLSGKLKNLDPDPYKPKKLDPDPQRTSSQI